MKILAEAERIGYLIGNGIRIRVIAEYNRRCRSSSIPSVLLIRGARKSQVQVSGRKAWTGPNDEATDVVLRHAHPKEQQVLFD